MARIKPLANEFVTLFESPDPENVYAYTPGLALLPSGRIVATFDLGGPKVKDLPGLKWQSSDDGWATQGKVFTSDDRGATWTHRTDYPFIHARPCVAARSLYVLGHAHDLTIIRSDDRGDTWSAATTLTHGQRWHQSACNVHYANGCVYLSMERRTRNKIKSWPVGDFAPVLMRGRVDDDLTRRENWTFASELPFYEALNEEELDYFGVPFYQGDPVRGLAFCPGRHFDPMGWLETNVVQFTHPDHIWSDPSGRTFHLWMRAHTGSTGYAAIAKAVENEDGSMTTLLQTAPSGRKIAYLPCPGGQNRFHILYDEPTERYWLLSVQATDSMRRPEGLPEDRYNLPSDERRRLQLHFSKNCVDWCFAGLVAVGPVERASRHYAGMIIQDDDLHILSRSGDEQAKTPHNVNLITFHTVKHFRELIY